MLGGLALANWGAAWCFGLNGVSFVAVIISLLIVRTRFRPKKTGESMLASMKQGIAFVRQQSAMEGLIVLAFCMTALAIPLIVFLPVFARDVLHGDAKTFTILLGCSGAGSVAGALVVAGLGRMRNQGRAALISAGCARRDDRRLLPVAIRYPERRAGVHFGSGADLRIRDDQFAGAD